MKAIILPLKVLTMLTKNGSTTESDITNISNLYAAETNTKARPGRPC